MRLFAILAALAIPAAAQVPYVSLLRLIPCPTSGTETVVPGISQGKVVCIALNSVQASVPVEGTVTGAIDGTNRVFDVTPAPRFMLLFVGGIRVRAGAHYDTAPVTGGVRVTFKANVLPPQIGEDVSVVVWP